LTLHGEARRVLQRTFGKRLQDYEQYWEWRL
jgi:hypothetical protein